MDQLKEYIPLLIIALSFFFSFIGGKKKKKRNKEEVASEGFNDFEVPAYFEDTDPATEKKEKYNHNYNSIKREEHPFYVERSENLEMEYNPEEIVSEQIIDLSNGDELKKAIIYSEIFQKKYF